MRCLRQTHQRRGIALVIVLAFVVLLTVVVVAFFSRAMSERQISNSSVTQTRVELFALGAADVVIADLKQEIVAGSNATSLNPQSAGVIYTPKAGTAAAAPSLVGTTGDGGYENLVKRSVNGIPFYPASKYDGNASNRAAKLSTLTPSRNGRFIAPARWNKPLLLRKANPDSDTDFTPVGV